MFQLVKQKKLNLLTLIKFFLVTFLLFYFLYQALFQTSVIEGKSMDPTYEQGELVLANKWVYMFDDPKRGDVVIIEKPTKQYIKRIIALPNETVEVRNHTLYINGEPYAQHFLPIDVQNSTTDFGPIVIPKDSYFVMGDNRIYSKDSRNGLGFISRDEIIAKSLKFP